MLLKIIQFIISNLLQISKSSDRWRKLQAPWKHFLLLTSLALTRFPMTMTNINLLSLFNLKSPRSNQQIESFRANVRSASWNMQIFLPSRLLEFNITRLTSLASQLLSYQISASYSIVLFSYWLSALRVGSLERVRCKVWNWHEITNKVDSPRAWEWRQALRISNAEAGLRRLPM